MTSFGSILWLSIYTALSATLLILPFSIGSAWLLARKKFPGKSFLEATIQLPLIVPPVVTGYFLLFLLGPKGIIGQYFDAIQVQIAFTWFAAVLAAAVVSLPLAVRSVRIAIDGVDPRLEETARTLGASEWAIFRTITLPLSYRGIIAGSVLAFARSLGEFGATIVFAGNIPNQSQTIPLAIFQYINQPDGMGKAQSLVIAAIFFSYVSMFISEWVLKKVDYAAH